MFTNKEFPNAATSAYYKFARRSPLRACDHDGHDWRECPELRIMFNRAFSMGAEYAIKTSGELAPYLQRFTEFIMWLSDTDEVAGYQIGLPD